MQKYQTFPISALWNGKLISWGFGAVDQKQNKHLRTLTWALRICNRHFSLFRLIDNENAALYWLSRLLLFCVHFK